jgi:putative lipoprotein
MMAPTPSPSAGGAGAAAASVRGSAFYRERIALPPGAVFEASLEDVSRADAPAEVLGGVSFDGGAGPHYAFSIP